MSDIAEVFNELLFGSGSWLGLIIILSIIVTICVSSRNRWVTAIFIPISIFIGLEYFNNVGVSDSFMWSGVIMFLTALFLALMAIRQKG